MSCISLPRSQSGHSWLRCLDGEISISAGVLPLAGFSGTAVWAVPAPFAGSGAVPGGVLTGLCQGLSDTDVTGTFPSLRSVPDTVLQVQ